MALTGYRFTNWLPIHRSPITGRRLAVAKAGYRPQSRHRYVRVTRQYKQGQDSIQSPAVMQRPATVKKGNANILDIRVLDVRIHRPSR